LSREDPDFYRYAVQNAAAVIVLYVLKILLRFDVFSAVA